MHLPGLARVNREQFGEYTMMVYHNQTYTNFDLDRAADGLAAGLRRLGVRPGDRVLVMLPNGPEVPVSYQGVARTGAVIVPLLGALEAAEVAQIAADCAPVAAIAGVASINKIPPGLLTVVVGGTGPAAFAVLAATAPDGANHEPAPADLAVILYTSGTTGQPKGVMLSHHNLAAAAAAGARARGVGAEHTVLLTLPLSHSYGLTVMNAMFLQGCRAVVLPRFGEEEFCRAVQAYGVYQTALVPAMLARLLRFPAFGQYDLTSLKLVAVASAPCPAEVLLTFQERTGARVLEGYGLSEAAPTVTLSRPWLPQKIGSSGTPVDGVALRVTDGDGRVLPAGEVGELWVRGPNIMMGYYNRPEETAATLVDGWCRTGDVARIDIDGDLYIVERKKDLIIRGGFNIVPRDVEEVLHRHPAVAEAAVVGAPDPVLGEVAVAYVALHPGAAAAAADLLAWCRQHLAKYKCPERVEFLTSLPRNSLGKVLKRELKRAWP